MPALDQGTAVMLLDGLTGTSAYVATTTPLKLLVCMNTPTATVPGTQISGSGYTAGGQTITFSAPTGTATGAIALNSAAITWTNGGSAAWNVYGIEIWDSAGTPVRKAFGPVDDAPLVIGPGSPLTFAIGSIAWVFP